MNTKRMAKPDVYAFSDSMGYVEAEFLSLADGKLVPGTGCMTCFGYMALADEEAQGYHSQGDIKVVAPKIEAQKQRRAARE